MKKKSTFERTDKRTGIESEIITASAAEPIKDRSIIEGIKTALNTKKLRKYYALFCTGINTALRISDILKLKVLEDYMNEVDGELLFPNSDGGFIDANNFRDRVWNKLMEKMDFNKHVCLHGLRKSYIDISISQNIPIKFIQNNVGHAKCEVTLDVYANNNAEMVVFAKQQMQYAFTSCYQNVIKKPKTEKSNVIQFPKRPSASGL